MKGYKGFEKGLVCKGKQYTENTEFEENGGKICESGMMHFCKRPLDVLEYYPIVDENGNFNEFAEVETDDFVTDGTKCATKKLKIRGKISFAKLVELSVKYDLGSTSCNSQTGYRSGNSQTGDYSGNSQTGDYSGNSQTGYCSGNSQTGYCSGNSQTGHYSGNSQTGYRSGNSQTGDYSGNGQTGDYSGNSQTGYYSGNSQTGDYSGNSQTGDYSGNSQTGYRSGNSQTGYYSKSEQNGKFSASLSTGFKCSHEANGESCIAVGWGKDNKAKGKKGSYIVLAEHYKKKEGIKTAKMVLIDGEKIKEDTWYKLKNGKFVEVDD